MKALIVLCGIIGMLITIKWDKEAGKAFITGGISGAWVLYIILKKRNR